MYARVSHLCHCKSYYTSDMCEDAALYDISRGVLAIADGVTTAAESGRWASILVNHYITTPLMGVDSFEIEWWLQQAQQVFKAKVSANTSLNDPSSAQLTRDSHSTLTCLRCSCVYANSCVQVEVMSIGDSCVFVGNAANHEVFSFPYDQPGDLNMPPLCLPTKGFQRDFHKMAASTIEIKPGDVIVLATDAVSRWILDHPESGTGSRWDALEEISQCVPDRWPVLVNEWREQNLIQDDDSSALVVELENHPADGFTALGTSTRYCQEVLLTRRTALNAAIRQKNLIGIAILAGDERWLDEQEKPDVDIPRARRVAQAIYEIVEVLRQGVDNPSVLQQAWDKHAVLLQDEPCAEHLKLTLLKKGVITFGSLAVNQSNKEQS